MMKMRAFFASAVFLCASAAPVLADPIDLSATLSVNFLTGYHVEAGTRYRVAEAPLPIAAADARYRRVALHLEALPPVTFGYTGNPANIQSTRLSLVTASARFFVRGGTFVGIGSTVYNQNTDRGTLGSPPVLSSEDDSSRIAGARFEIGDTRALAPRTTLETVFSLAPVMHGLEDDEHTTIVNPGPPYPTNIYSCEDSNVHGYIECVFNGPAARGLPERASQIDTSATLVHRFRHGSLIAGVRYLNYAAAYALTGNRANKAVADRNAGFMPLIGYRWGTPR
jgi:hypothetical protein